MGYQGAPTYEEMPDGYITAGEYCQRFEIALSSFANDLKRRGLVNPKHLAWLHTPRRGRPTRIIHWHDAAMERLNRLKPPYLPWWADPTAEARPDYALLPDNAEKAVGTAARSRTLSDSFLHDKMIHGSSDEDSVPAENLHSAKLRIDQLKIAKAELEIQAARNRLVPIAEASNLMRSVAVETRQAIMSIVPRLGPVLAAEMDPHVVMQQLEAELTEALQSVSRLDPRNIRA